MLRIALPFAVLFTSLTAFAGEPAQGRAEEARQERSDRLVSSRFTTHGGGQETAARSSSRASTGSMSRR